ncbi:MAG: hypothetical protein Q9218_002809, partial [Villophora microphyllina]
MLYIRSAATIIAYSIRSPKDRLLRKGVPANELASSLPALNRFSDVAWYVWNDILSRPPTGNQPADTLFVNEHKSPNDPGRLQYVGHNLITNSVTKAVIEYIIAERNGGDAYKPWPGVTLDVSEEDEGKA